MAIPRRSGRDASRSAPRAAPSCWRCSWWRSSPISSPPTAVNETSLLRRASSAQPRALVRHRRARARRLQSRGLRRAGVDVRGARGDRHRRRRSAPLIGVAERLLPRPARPRAAAPRGRLDGLPRPRHGHRAAHPARPGARQRHRRPRASARPFRSRAPSAAPPWSCASTPSSRRAAPPAPPTCACCSGTCCPNILASVIIVASTSLGFVILVEAAVSFLGYGVPPPQPSWGGMLSATGRQYMLRAPWLSIFPGLRAQPRGLRLQRPGRRAARPARSAPARGLTAGRSRAA